MAENLLRPHIVEFRLDPSQDITEVKRELSALRAAFEGLVKRLDQTVISQPFGVPTSNMVALEGFCCKCGDPLGYRMIGNDGRQFCRACWERRQEAPRHLGGGLTVGPGLGFKPFNNVIRCSEEDLDKANGSEPFQVLDTWTGPATEWTCEGCKVTRPITDMKFECPTCFPAEKERMMKFFKGNGTGDAPK